MTEMAGAARPFLFVVALSVLVMTALYQSSRSRGEAMKLARSFP
jgi:hypothetical protein